MSEAFLKLLCAYFGGMGDCFVTFGRAADGAVAFGPLIGTMCLFAADLLGGGFLAAILWHGGKALRPFLIPVGAALCILAGMAWAL